MGKFKQVGYEVKNGERNGLGQNTELSKHLRDRSNRSLGRSNQRNTGNEDSGCHRR